MENLVFFVIPALFVYICLIVHLSRKGNLGLMSMYLQSSCHGDGRFAEIKLNTLETANPSNPVESIIIDQPVIERESVLVASRA